MSNPIIIGIDDGYAAIKNRPLFVPNRAGSLYP